MILYHGTFAGAFGQFDPFSHFGTETAAIERIAHKMIEGVNGTPRVISVEIDVESASVLEVFEDWGSNQPIALARAMKDHYRQRDRELYDQFESLRLDLMALKKEFQPYKDVGNQRLQDLFHQIEIDIIKYKNDVEDAKSFSYCIVDPINAANLNFFTPCHDRLEIAKRVVNDILNR